MRKIKPKAKAYKVLEELCNDSDCTLPGTHWHPFSAASMLKEAVGEYSVTLRVRKLTTRPKAKR
jgi:hypothetical protein